MDRKRNGKRIAIVLILLAAICITAIFCIKGSANAPNSVEVSSTELQEEEVVQETEDKSATKEEISKAEDRVQEEKSNDSLGSSVNAYEYILSIMREPQYWSEEEYFPVYSSDYLEEEARETLINGSGWVLSDEATASFTRGYEGELTICFSDFTAVSKDTTTNYEYRFDFKNEKYSIYLGSEKEGEFSLNKNSDAYGYSAFALLEDTFSEYERIFTAMGCPLLLEKAGTLSSYKNKQVEKVSIKSDGLIHNIWDEGFSFNWENEEGLTWLTNVNEVATKSVPESELVSSNVEYLDGHIETFEAGIYSPVFLVLADKESSSKYQVRDGSYWFEDVAYYDNISESLATYFLMPAMNNLYGYNAVYFADAKNLSGPENPKLILTIDEFKRGFTYDYKSGSQLIMECLPLGNNFVYMSYQADSNYILFGNLFSVVKSLYDYYGVDFPYGDDYLGNFLLVYSLDSQRLLGLR